MKAVLFDLDDTLVDHQHSYRSSLAAVQQRYAALQQHAFEDLEQVYNHWLNRLHTEVIAGRYSLDQARIERFRQIFLHCGTTLSDVELAQVAELQREVYQASQQPIAGVVPLLMHLRSAGLQIGVATNHLRGEQVAKLRDCELDIWVDAMVTTEDVGIPKPDPTMFLAILRQLDCQPDEVVMVGDSWTSDILGATALGIRSLWLNRYGRDCPDPALAVEFHGYEPLEAMLRLLGIAQ
jgi:putative hydrolase of the HAD superfamily